MLKNLLRVGFDNLIIKYFIEFIAPFCIGEKDTNMCLNSSNISSVPKKALPYCLC